MRDLRLVQPVVLVLANALDTAVDLVMRVRDARCVGVQPRSGESAVQAVARLRPALVLVEVGHRELFGGGLWGAASEIDAQVLMFGRGASEVAQAEARYGVRVLSIDSPAAVFRTMVSEASHPPRSTTRFV